MDHRQTGRRPVKLLIGISLSLALIVAAVSAVVLPSSAAPATRQIQLYPNAGPPGTIVTVVAQGMPARSSGWLNFGATRVATFNTGGGSVNFAFGVPDNAKAGKATVSAVVANRTVARATFTVQSGQTSPPPTDTPTQTPTHTPTMTPPTEPNPGDGDHGGEHGGNGMYPAYAMGAPWTSQPSWTQPAGAPTPVAGQPCPVWVHDRYAAQGPDGLWYPTWHAETDPQYGCHFGHEHGDDPTGSPALRGHPVLFGYAEYYAEGHVDPHNGFKVSRWDQYQGYNQNTSKSAYAVFVQHQMTSSDHRFMVSSHSFEVHYYNPADGRELHLDVMDTFNDLVVRGCGAAPDVTIHRTNAGGSGSKIQVPGANCYKSGPDGNQYEDWVSSQYIGRDGSGNYVAYLDPHFAVFNPNTFCDLQANNICELGHSDTALGNGRDPLGPDSQFKGDHRETYMNQVWIKNAGGSTTVWTDPYGKRVAPGTPGAIEQFVSAVNVAPQDQSVAFGADRNHDPSGTVQAPN